MILGEVSNSSISHPFWRFPHSLYLIHPILALHFHVQYQMISSHNFPPHPALFSRMYCHAYFFLFMVIYSNKFLFTHCNFRTDFSLTNVIVNCSDICKDMFFSISLKFAFQKQRFNDPYTFFVESVLQISALSVYTFKSQFSEILNQST